MAFTAGSTYKIQDVYAIVFNEELTISGGILEQGVTITQMIDQTVVVANGATVVKNEKVSVSFSLIGDAYYINEAALYCKQNPETWDSMNIILNDEEHGTTRSQFYITGVALQVYEVVKANDLLRLNCTVEISTGDADSIMTFIPKSQA
jgi:hypothetical protein